MRFSSSCTTLIFVSAAFSAFKGKAHDQHAYWQEELPLLVCLLNMILAVRLCGCALQKAIRKIIVPLLTKC